MKGKRILLLLWGLAIVAAMQAGDSLRIRRAATQGLQAMGLMADDMQQVASGEGYTIYGGKERGFVVVGNVEGHERVLGSSPSRYDADAMPCGLRWWLDAVSRASRHPEAPEETASTHRASYTSTPNFLTTTWGQWSPFNDLCPKDDDNKTCPTGCAATAIAQVMRYYQWPQQGHGIGEYHIIDDNRNILRTETEAISGVYDWQNMTDSYKSTATDVEKEAVATLMADCGKAVEMRYNIKGSGAYVFNQALGMARHFSYDSLAMNYLQRAHFSRDEWLAVIAEEIQHHRPVLYAGYSKQNGASGGHAFILSGMESDGRVYVNWGWNGSHDGFFELYGLTVGNNSLADDQEMIIGIYPADGTSPGGEYRSQWSVYKWDRPYLATDKSIYINYYWVINQHFLPFTGDVGLLIESTDGQGYSQMKLLEEMYDGELGFEAGYTNCQDIGNSQYSWTAIQVTFDELPAGCYSLTWVSKARQETVCRPMTNYDSGELQAPFYLGKRHDGTLVVSDTKVKDITSSILNAQRTTHDAPATMDNGCYNLYGQRVESGYHGIVIQNGKKRYKP